MNILPQWVKRNSSVSHDTDATAFAEDHGTSQVHEAEMSPEHDAYEAADAMAPAPAETPQVTDVHDAPARPARSAWDLADDGTTPYIGVPQAQTQSRPVIEFPAAERAEPAAPAPVAGTQQKPNATRTRLIGFDKSDGTSVELFDQPLDVAPGIELLADRSKGLWVGASTALDRFEHAANPLDVLGPPGVGPRFPLGGRCRVTAGRLHLLADLENLHQKPIGQRGVLARDGPTKQREHPPRPPLRSPRPRPCRRSQSVTGSSMAISTVLATRSGKPFAP